MRVLIVEDDFDTQVLLQDILESFPWQFTIETADTGEGAIHRASQTPPDLVLLDVHLADRINGYEVARHLRSQPETSNACIVMLSGMDDPVDQHTGKRAGADEYITKPVQSRILLATLQELLDKR